MIKHNPYQNLGKAQHGWLNASHHFSFGQYYNPNKMGFGTLRVINDDWIAPNTGFAEHPHKNMEIITFMRSGSISHKDSKGNEGVTSAGQLQVMSAGKGVRHSEHNKTNKPVTLFQIWIEPNKLNVPPRWDNSIFPTQQDNSQLPLLVSGYPEDKQDALFIHQQARIFGGKVGKGTVLTHKITHQAYILASDGAFELINNRQCVSLNKGDGAEVTEEKSIKIHALEDSEIIIIDAP